MVLTRVDLPAPLSPTRATTSPASTLNSMSLRACTAPKRLDTPVIDNTGVGEVVVMLCSLLRQGGAGSAGGPGSAEAGLGAGVGVLRGADVGHLVEVVRDDRVLDVVHRDDDRVEQRGRDALFVGGCRRVLAVGEGDRVLRGVLGLRLARRVDRRGP